MKALIWKEWRENLPWAAVVWAVLGMIFLPGLALMGMDPIKPEHNIFEGMEWISLEFAPLTATVLGYMQISRDSAIDKWAFLVHRPVTRTSIFCGKAIGGLSLYLVAFCIPFLAFALVPLVEPRLSLASQLYNVTGHLKWIVIGGNFYFVGMLVAMRRTRWYGSRFLPILAAFAWLLALDFCPPAWHTDWYALIGGLVLGLAAWGSILTDGGYDRQPRLAKIGLGITMYVGICTIFTFSFGLPIMAVLFRTFSTFPDKNALYQTLRHKSPPETSPHLHIGAEVFGSSISFTPATFGPPQILITPPVLAGFLWMREQRGELGPQQGKTPSGSIGTNEHNASVQNAALLRSAIQNFVVATIIVALLCCCPVFLVTRRARLSRFEILIWSFSTLFLGLTGVLLLLALRGWPPLESCPQCGRKRSIYNEQCEHCGAPPKRPELDATTIFSH